MSFKQITDTITRTVESASESKQTQSGPQDPDAVVERVRIADTGSEAAEKRRAAEQVALEKRADAIRKNGGTRP